MPVKIVVAGILFVISVPVGICLRKMGLPLNTPVFTVHKLLSVAGVIVGVIGYIQLLKAGNGGSLLVLLAIAAALFAAGLIATGALMSLQKSIGTGFLNLHRAATLLLIADLAGAVILQTAKQ